MTKLSALGFGGLGILGFVALSGCGATLQLKETRLADAEPGRTFLLVGLDVEDGGAVPAKSVCELTSRNRDDGKTYALSIQPKDATVLAEVVPGRYAWESLRCGNSMNWTLGESLPLAALVQPGKINYAGRLKFKISKSALSSGYGARGEDASALASALKALPAGTRSQAVTAYSGKAVSLETIASRSGNRRAIAITKKGEEKPQVDALNAALDACEREERDSNPVRLGSLAYEIEFEGGSLKRLDKVGDRHTLSDRYVGCVEAVFRATQPGTRNSVVYRIQL